ncbi:putative membrane protein YfkQ [Paenibacillus marchantiophytorum]|uniref:Membrane protein YfkQ n=1 Tax=Paenibacillus marchantiophytorum TaxID=1619310 RepID=A0ABQ1ELP0_9BACL|nr:spore germination protein [Paenibacillus marchantiophytorum]GFZ77496.1 putative membrane protein YfkQ [Paenibacillus marchantiophytorum]
MDTYSSDSSEAVSSSIDINLQMLKSIYDKCKDVHFHEFIIGGTTKAFVVHFEGMVNLEILDRNVLTPLLAESAEEWKYTEKDLSSLISISDIREMATLTEMVAPISSGSVGLFIDGVAKGFALGLAKWEKRSIEEPSAESIIRGPREGFTETMSVNTSMLRRKIKSSSLKMVAYTVGKHTQTEVLLIYMEGIANASLVEEVSQRIADIQIDGILESGYIEGLIEDNPFSPFPQIQVTERPDVVCAALLEGKVSILVDGTPFALVAPATLFSLLQSPEDYYQRFIIGTFIRWLRYLFFFITLLLPSLYVAILTYHQEMVPTSLLLSIAKSREDIPFPALIEALLMEVSFEALREAGVRLPKQVGAAVSIVGALVIGQAATSAGLVSAPMVMVVAITGIASFMMPQYSAGIALRMLRFPIMFLSGMLGLLGLMLGFIVIVIHLSSLRSLGVPYLQPIAPMKGAELKDVLIRAPIWAMRTRPKFTGKSNSTRLPAKQKPEKPKGNESDD